MSQERSLRRQAKRWLEGQGYVVHVNTGAGPVGRPDLDVWDGERAWMIELKTDVGTLSPAQKLYHEHLRGRGVRVEVCRSMADVKATVGVRP